MKMNPVFNLIFYVNKVERVASCQMPCVPRAGEVVLIDNRPLLVIQVRYRVVEGELRGANILCEYE